MKNEINVKRFWFSLSMFVCSLSMRIKEKNKTPVTFSSIHIYHMKLALGL